MRIDVSLELADTVTQAIEQEQWHERQERGDGDRMKQLMRVILSIFKANVTKNYEKALIQQWEN